ncbi:hypothetical protein DFH09DRAFT_1392888 [Mycena vulgaris]|nr:hypothetical protein DFH09DRAFT_1392888 [Mycena vulgaris]
MALAGRAAGRDVGMWSGTNAAADALKTLVDVYPTCGLDVSVATEGTLSQTEVFAASHSPAAIAAAQSHSRASSGQRPDFARAGSTRPEYGHAHGQGHALMTSSCTPRAARAAPARTRERARGPACGWTPRPLTGLDPSILIGFVCRDEVEWIDLRRRVWVLHPNYLRYSRRAADDDDVGLESISDPEEAADNRFDAGDVSSASHAPSSSALYAVSNALTPYPTHPTSRPRPSRTPGGFIDGGGLIDAGGDVEIEDDWVDPVAPRPPPAPKRGRSKSEGKGKKLGPVAVPGVHYSFHVSQNRERERERLRNVTVSAGGRGRAADAHSAGTLILSSFTPKYTIHNSYLGTSTAVTVVGFDSNSVRRIILAGTAAYVANVTMNGVPSASRCHLDFYDAFRLGGNITITLTADKAAADDCLGALPESLSTGGFSAAR